MAGRLHSAGRQPLRPRKGGCQVKPDKASKAQAVDNALAGLDGCADLTDTEVDLLRKVSAWNGETARAYASQALRAFIQSDIEGLYSVVVLADDPTPAAVKYWREVEPLALKAGLHPFPNGSPSQAAGDGRAGAAPAAKPRRQTSPALRPKA